MAGPAVNDAATAFEVAGMLPWTRRERKLADLDEFSQMLAVLEAAAHLDVLVMQGHLRAMVSDGITGYVLGASVPDQRCVSSSGKCGR
jgi:hypothetical protein